MQIITPDVPNFKAKEIEAQRGENLAQILDLRSEPMSDSKALWANSHSWGQWPQHLVGGPVVCVHLRLGLWVREERRLREAGVAPPGDMRQQSKSKEVWARMGPARAPEESGDGEEGIGMSGRRGKRGWSRGCM